MPLVILINFFSIPLRLENNGHKTRYASFANINIFTKYDLLQFINSILFLRSYHDDLQCMYYIYPLPYFASYFRLYKQNC